MRHLPFRILLRLQTTSEWLRSVHTDIAIFFLNCLYSLEYYFSISFITSHPSYSACSSPFYPPMNSPRDPLEVEEKKEWRRNGSSSKQFDPGNCLRRLGKANYKQSSNDFLVISQNTAATIISL
jgi:hypothetical protein